MKRYQKASSLLLTTVTIAAASIVMLAGASAFIAASRQQSQQVSAAQARWYARSALREGISRVSTLAGLTPNGEYGLIATGASQATDPQLRGAQAATQCASLSLDPGSGAITPGDDDCPKQEMAVRSLVTVRSVDTSPASYTYKAADFPVGTTVNLRIVPQASQTTNPILQFTRLFPLNAFTYQLCTSATDDASCSAAVDPGAVPFSTTPTTMRVRITATSYTGVPNPTDDVLRVRSASDATYTIGKGFTTVDVAAIMPDAVEVRYLAIIRPSGTVVRARTDAFNSDGFCNPNPDACR